MQILVYMPCWTSSEVAGLSSQIDGSITRTRYSLVAGHSQEWMALRYTTQPTGLRRTNLTEASDSGNPVNVRSRSQIARHSSDKRVNKVQFLAGVLRGQSGFDSQQICRLGNVTYASRDQ